MKKIYWIGALLFLTAISLMSCRKKETPPEDGGVIHDSGSAPKTVDSLDITSFSCYFSAADLLEEDSPLAGQTYWLKAEQKEGKVEGSFCSLDRFSNEQKFAFEAELSFFEQLQTIVSQQNLAQHNGHYHSVSGLPGGYGAELSILYASGESISAFDNQDNFLSVECMEQLNALFSGQDINIK